MSLRGRRTVMRFEATGYRTRLEVSLLKQVVLIVVLEQRSPSFNSKSRRSSSTVHVQGPTLKRLSAH